MAYQVENIGKEFDERAIRALGQRMDDRDRSEDENEGGDGNEKDQKDQKDEKDEKDEAPRVPGHTFGTAASASERSGPKLTTTAAAVRLLHLYCEMPAVRLDELVNTKRAGPDPATGCLDTRTGTPLDEAESMSSHQIQKLSSGEAREARSSFDEFTHAFRFDSAVISRSIAALAATHLRNLSSSDAAQVILPIDSQVYRGSFVLLHPHLGAFYRVRVPVFHNYDAHAYRQECFRRPWGLLRAEFGGLRARSAGGSVVHAIMVLHEQVRVTSVLAAAASAGTTAGLDLTVVLCAQPGCVRKEQLRGVEKNGVAVVSAGSVSLGAAGKDPWGLWFLRLEHTLRSFADSSDSGGDRDDDEAVVIVDGHTSAFPTDLASHVRRHVVAAKQAILFATEVSVPTQHWRGHFSAGALSRTPSQEAYARKTQYGVAFTLRDGLAALEAWAHMARHDGESSRISGGGAAACGRATLAWLIRSALSMDVVILDSLTGGQLHAWNRSRAEVGAREWAKHLRHEGALQAREARAAFRGAERSSVTSHLLSPPQEPPLFFPRGLSARMVAPEEPPTGAYPICDHALDAMGFCTACQADRNALVTQPASSDDVDSLTCSAYLGEDGGGAEVNEGNVFRTFNPLHGITYRVAEELGRVKGYTRTLGEADVFV